MDYFRQKCEENPKSVTDISENFLRIAEKLDFFVTNPRLKAVTKISHARLLGVAILLNKALDTEPKKQILEEWEKVTFRIFGLCRKDARTKVGEYVRLARLVFHNEDPSGKEILKKLASLGEEYPANEVAKTLKDTNCYEGWEDELIYFLYRYEEHLTHKYSGSISDEVWTQVWNSSPNKTIEHIHPQNINEHWRGKIGVKKDYVEKQAQRLGNLVILPTGVNSSASNKPFNEKKLIYNKHRQLKLIDEILAKDDWDLNALIEREERLISWAEKEWE